MDKIKRYLVIVVTSLLLFTQAWAAERTAPTFPTSATVESGKTYYLLLLSAKDVNSLPTC